MNIRLRYINTVTHNCTNSDENRKDVLILGFFVIGIVTLILTLGDRRPIDVSRGIQAIPPL